MPTEKNFSIFSINNYVIKFLLLFFYCCFSNNLFAQKTLKITELKDVENITEYLKIAEEKSENSTIADVQLFDFKELKSAKINSDAPVHWLKFKIENNSDIQKLLRLNITFTDSVFFYVFNENAALVYSDATGDLYPVNQRSIPNGQMVFTGFSIPPNKVYTAYIKLKSVSNISQQFRAFTLNSINIYTETGFWKRFTNPTIFQAIFYGALFIMLIYNLLIYIILKDKSYLHYVLFLSFLIIFLLANSGYLVELVWPGFPRNDLYLRFLSAPLLIISYILFSRQYLQPQRFATGLNKVLNVLLFLLVTASIAMALGYWMHARTFVVILAITSFLSILFLSIKVMRSGFSPAAYFLAANILLIIGAFVFTSERIFSVVENPFTKYGLQVAVLLQVALLSIGLAEKFNLFRKQFTEQIIENEKLALQKEIEKNEIIEEKNRELEIKVIERTEQINQQKLNLEHQNNLLNEARQLVNRQNKTLETINEGLEKAVQERTEQLNSTNIKLQKSVDELDAFIYRTSHDIRGPLARLMGLCNLATSEIKDVEAQQYFNMLTGTAYNLDHILKRLFRIYEVSRTELKIEKIHLLKIVENTLDELKTQFTDNEINLSLEIEENLNFESDRRLINTILLNLIENSLKFRHTSDDKQTDIQIIAKKHNNTIRISILDNGIGIQPEDKPHLFELFSKAAMQHKTPGLGLYIARICAERLSGTINYDEHNQCFTEFTIEFPAASIETEENLPVSLETII